MKKPLVMALAVAAALALTAAQGWAGKGTVLSDGDLAAVYAGDEIISDDNVRNNDDSELIFTGEAQRDHSGVNLLNEVASINAQQSNVLAMGGPVETVNDVTQLNVAYKALGSQVINNNNVRDNDHNDLLLNFDDASDPAAAQAGSSGVNLANSMASIGAQQSNVLAFGSGSDVTITSTSLVTQGNEAFVAAGSGVIHNNNVRENDFNDLKLANSAQAVQSGVNLLNEAASIEAQQSNVLAFGSSVIGTVEVAPQTNVAYKAASGEVIKNNNVRQNSDNVVSLSDDAQSGSTGVNIANAMASIGAQQSNVLALGPGSEVDVDNDTLAQSNVAFVAGGSTVIFNNNVKDNDDNALTLSDDAQGFNAGSGTSLAAINLLNHVASINAQQSNVLIHVPAGSPGENLVTANVVDQDNKAFVAGASEVINNNNVSDNTNSDITLGGAAQETTTGVNMANAMASVGAQQSNVLEIESGTIFDDAVTIVIAVDQDNVAFVATGDEDVVIGDGNVKNNDLNDLGVSGTAQRSQAGVNLLNQVASIDAQQSNVLAFRSIIAIDGGNGGIVVTQDNVAYKAGPSTVIGDDNVQGNTINTVSLTESAQESWSGVNLANSMASIGAQQSNVLAFDVGSEVVNLTPGGAVLQTNLAYVATGVGDDVVIGGELPGGNVYDNDSNSLTISGTAQKLESGVNLLNQVASINAQQSNVLGYKGIVGEPFTVFWWLGDPVGAVTQLNVAYEAGGSTVIGDGNASDNDGNSIALSDWAQYAFAGVNLNNSVASIGAQQSNVLGFEAPVSTNDAVTQTNVAYHAFSSTVIGDGNVNGNGEICNNPCVGNSISLAGHAQQDSTGVNLANSIASIFAQQSNVLARNTSVSVNGSVTQRNWAFVTGALP